MSVVPNILGCLQFRTAGGVCSSRQLRMSVVLDSQECLQFCTSRQLEMPVVPNSLGCQYFQTAGDV